MVNSNGGGGVDDYERESTDGGRGEEEGCGPGKNSLNLKAHTLVGKKGQGVENNETEKKKKK